jgi:hypothetical protein
MASSATHLSRAPTAPGYRTAKARLDKRDILPSERDGLARADHVAAIGFLLARGDAPGRHTCIAQSVHHGEDGQLF